VDAALRAVSAGIADRYEIERELGSGGTAVVYLARDLRHDRHVAIKVLRPDISASVSGERFLREVRVAARLAHAHIVGLIDSGRVATETGGDLLYYVMPFVHGESLRDRLRREGQLPVTDALRIASEVADALAFAHAHGVIHRDIKPENILLSGATPAGASTAHAQVADFGIARLLGDSDAALTATGVSIGTPPYMSPEQASGDRTITERTDIYSLGCVLYEMLVGEPPFTGPNASAIFARHLSAPMPGIRTVRPGVPDEVEALVRSALEKVPADRIGDAATLKSRLDEARERSSYERRSAGTPGRAANGRAWAFAIAATLVAATLGGYLVVSRAQRTGAAVVPTVPAGDAKRLDPSKIAVMPFKLNGDTARAYVADASTDELISALSRVGGLRVVARSSVQSGVAGGRSPVETARELSAGSLIEGTITEHDASITYEVAVVDVNTGEHAWSKRYERRGSDMAGLQDSVARAVAARLLSRESLGSPDVATRVSGPAHDAYLHGVYFARRAWQRPDSRAIEDSAIRYFQRALAIDPAYAVAHASIAEMYTRRFFNYDPNPEWEQRAFSEIEKALAIDPNLPEAYQAKGNLTWTRANAFPHEAAAKLHRRATALKPSFVEPHQSLGSLYMHIGLLDSALAEFATALDLDPATPLVPPRIARVHWYQGKYDVALRELEAIDKPLVSFAAERALILNYLGRSSEALSYLNGLQGSSEESYDFAAARAVIHASRGERALALSAIARALQGGEKASHFHHAEYSIAEAYALLGDKDRALEFLRKTAEDGMPCYPLFQRDPHLRSLADDPRFKQFMTDLKDRWERLGQVLFQPSNKLP
jgi:serine/threonine-protein kinase